MGFFVGLGEISGRAFSCAFFREGVRAIAEDLTTPMATAVPEQPQVLYVPMQVTALSGANPFGIAGGCGWA